MNKADTVILKDVYSTATLPLDQLAYTTELELMFADYVLRTGHRITLREFWSKLISARKAGKLGRKGRRTGVTDHGASPVAWKGHFN